MRVHDLYRLLDQRKGKSSISFHFKLLKLAKKKKGKNKIDFLTEREREVVGKYSVCGFFGVNYSHIVYHYAEVNDWFLLENLFHSSTTNFNRFEFPMRHQETICYL